jgi:hypothetical protein
MWYLDKKTKKKALGTGLTGIVAINTLQIGVDENTWYCCEIQTFGFAVSAIAYSSQLQNGFWKIN